MKHQWQKRRTVQEREDGQKRWDRAYLLVLEIAQTVQPKPVEDFREVNHASSDVCPRIDPASDTCPND